MMKTRYRVLPYRQGSKSAKALADALGGKVLKLEGSKYRTRHGDVIVNWGNTNLDHYPMRFRPQEGGVTAIVPFLNLQSDIRQASNKLQFFNLMRQAGHENIIPEFWTNRDSIPDDAFPIVCRTQLAGHSGAGIVLAASREELVAAPLYVKYVKKEQEYRIHVGKRGEEEEYVIVATQRKARRRDVPDADVNWQVRNLAGGFVYVREGVSPPAAVIDAARLALGATALDFGAVDVIWNAKQERAYVLEINTAPGLEGTTVEDYARFFRG